VKIRFAVAPGGRPFDAGELDEFLDAAESLGFDTVWLSDVPLGPIGDPLTSLTYAAARTSRVKLGANLVPAGRNPMLLARELAQLDQLSRGRLLISLVPGLNQPGESGALGLGAGTGRARRGPLMDDVIPLLRRWWAGECVTASYEQFEFESITVAPVPLQDPLEIWLGGHGPAALARTGRLADGWLTATITPDEAQAGRREIERHASEAGRVIDPEHFGISMPYARKGPAELAFQGLRARRPEVDLDQVLPVGAGALVDLLRRHIDAGLSKFVLRPVTPGATIREELAWLADAVLALQS
jgi:probable F420-dependent oxidoreductase